MKKLLKVLLGVVAVVGVLVGVTYVTTYKTPLERLSEEVGLNLVDQKILNSDDTFGWFNDGEKFVEVKLNDSFDYLLIESSWERIPFTSDLNQVLNETQIDFSFPEVEEGYYYVNGENEMRNYIVTVIDTKNNMLYYYKYNS